MIAVDGLCLDCREPSRVAKFWAGALGGRLGRTDWRDWLLSPPVGQNLLLRFRGVADEKVIRNRVRIELATDDFDRELARLLALGAVRLVDAIRNGAKFSTLGDVEGNEFGLIDLR